MTASTSAGEGSRGARVTSRPSSPEGQCVSPQGSLQGEPLSSLLVRVSLAALCLAVGVAIVMVSVVVVTAGVLINVMCWSCVRRR